MTKTHVITLMVTLSFVVGPAYASPPSAAIDGSLLDLIDQKAPLYFNSAWNLNINQFKAWLATIAWAEGGKAGYGAHSGDTYQGDQTSPCDAYRHKALGSSFIFSTGIGPFQLDRGSIDYWERWPTGRKIDPEEAVISVLNVHKQTFPSGYALTDFAWNSPWLAVNPNYTPGGASSNWAAVTGTDWIAHRAGPAPLDWPSIKSALAQNAAADPRYLYDYNVESKGLMRWNITAGQNVKTETGRDVIFDGDFPTRLIRSRRHDETGSERCRYYYAFRSDLGPYPIEVWVYDNSQNPDRFKYIFIRECYPAYPDGALPEHREIRPDGYAYAGEPTLSQPAIITGDGDPPTSPHKTNPPDLSSVNSTNVTFQWNAATDPDGGSVTYNLVVNDSGSNPVISVNNLSTLSYSGTIPGTNGANYYWQIWAVDDEGNSTEGDSGSWYFFWTDFPQRPTSPHKTNPSDSSSVNSTNVTFQWNAATDPDGGSVTYNLVVNDSGSNPVISVNNLSTLSYSGTIPGTNGANYYWQIWAVDDEGNSTEGDSGSWYFFWTDFPQQPVITTHPVSLTRNPGQSATFSVTATGTAPLSYQWRKNGGNISGATSSAYTIPSVQQSDEASYTCYVSNVAGNTTSNGATLTVTDPPQEYTITATFGENGTVEPNGVIDVNAGQNLTFTAQPNPGYTVDQWYLDGSAVQQGNTSYTLYNVQADHNVLVTFIEILPMDLNNDGIVNCGDFAIHAFYWMDDTCSEPDWCEGADIDMSGQVDFGDVRIIAEHWLEEEAEAPEGLVWVYIDDSGAGMQDWDGTPISHGGFTGEMSRYETTNAQYCQFLNAALASGDIRVSGNIVYGNSGEYNNQVYFATSAHTSESQIAYSGSTFSVRSRDGYSMANHPVVEVSWYGATAFCNYYGYRLPTEWEWQAVADYDGSYTYGCGTSINQSKANYDRANPLSLSSYPYTSPVDHYSSYGYGMNDMVGNVWEWTSSRDPSISSNHIIRGGGWFHGDGGCTVSYRSSYFSDSTRNDFGFRVCR